MRIRIERNLYVTTATVTACCLFLFGLSFYIYNSLTEADASPMFTTIMVILSIGGAAGVIWLSWYWRNLLKAISSMAERTREENMPHLKSKNHSVVRELADAINGQFDVISKSVAVLEKQSKDLRIEIQLSQRQKKNSEAIIYSIRDAVVVVDEFDRVMMANEAAGKLFGFDFKQSQLKPLDQLIGDDQKEFVEFLRQSRQTKVRAAKRELIMEQPQDKSVKTLDCIVSCVYEEKGPIFGVVAVLHDITKEKEISQMKNDFVSHVSHELKTPLASITAYSEMLVDGEADDESTRKEFYSVIQSQAKRLNRLIEDILNISRIESGLIKIKKERLSLTILIEEQMNMIKSYADDKNIKVIGQKPIVFDQVSADKDMISQVIINLLSNAIKYTKAGGTVKVETEVDEVGRLAKVSIIDTGIGIPADEVDHVFDKFYRVNANKKQAKGTGLGLNLVKQIIEKVHEGRVFVKSQVDVGSTFGFELPLATTETVKVSK